MHKKCATCDMLRDGHCAHPTGAGHHNDSHDEVCMSCATNERDTLRCLRM